MENTKKLDFYSYPLPALAEELKKQGKQKFRAQQLYKWVYEKNITDPEQMTNLAKDFRADLHERFSFELPKMVERKVSVDGTRKYLFDVGGFKTVEAVPIISRIPS